MFRNEQSIIGLIQDYIADKVQLTGRTSSVIYLLWDTSHKCRYSKIVIVNNEYKHG